MKELILINGTMGVGKTAVAAELAKLLDADWLDGDWCWLPEALCVNEKNRALALRNIGCLLRYELKNSPRRRLIFSWVMHRQDIIDDVLKTVAGLEVVPRCITLTCSEQVLRAHLEKDIAAGRRFQAIIERSIAHLPGYASQNTEKIDVSLLSAADAAKKIAAMLI